MSEKICTVRVEEFEEFMRYLEGCFGHSRGFFKRFYPHIYHPTPEACSWGYVIEKDGQVVSHVGLYPIEIVTAGIPLEVGGIGGVCTLPEERGHGYMSRLLHYVIGEMREIGYVISWLGGDRQRYNPFGWEGGETAYRLTFSRRSLGRAGVEPIPLVQKLPWEAEETIAQLQRHPACHARRPYLAHKLRKQGLRVWVAPNMEGYAIVEGEERDHLSIKELVSVPGRETSIIRAMLDDTFGERASWEMSVWDQERLARVMPGVARWQSGYSGMYRIVDLTQLLTRAKPFMASRAATLCDFDITVGIREHDRTTLTTVAVQNGGVEVQPGRHSKTYVELSPVIAARLFLGGPAISERDRIPAGLQALLPLPAYVPPLDHV